MTYITLCKVHFTGTYNQLWTDDERECKFCLLENMKPPKERLKKLLSLCLKYCKEVNGLTYCKNCGLDKESLELLDEIPEIEHCDVKECPECNKKAYEKGFRKGRDYWKEDKLKQIRRQILTSSFEANACHIGSALSCVEIMVDLFYNILKPEDIFLFSKASGVATYYSILADKGYFPKEKVAYYLKKYPLPSKNVPGVLHSLGSLGHGLPVSCGLAYANRDKRVYILISDAECQEGTFWECLLFKNQHNLDNLNIIVDWNNFQACGMIGYILNLPWKFIEQRGVKVIPTVKGKGVSFMEGENSWHYRNLTPELLEQALKENE